MASASLVDQVVALSRQLARIANALPDEDPLRPPDGKKNAPSFLFEMTVLLALLSWLRANDWMIVAERRDGRIRLVRAPAAKATGSVFRICKGALSFQITQGTEITDKYQKTRAPDICLQVGSASDHPTHADVLAMWDAKLRGDSGEPAEERISSGEFWAFVGMHSQLGAPLPGGDLLGSWPPAFGVCALISNGRRPTEPAQVLLDNHVSVVELFESENSAAWPTHEEHMEEIRKVVATEPREESSSASRPQ